MRLSAMLVRRVKVRISGLWKRIHLPNSILPMTRVAIKKPEVGKKMSVSWPLQALAEMMV